jgi:GNAT superfamily N-acetyltransferase
MPIREARETDRAYVEQTFARSYRDAPAVRGAELGTWLEEARRVVRMWAHEPARLVVYVPDEDDDAVIGWACGDARTLHYVYVRSEFRGGGIARELFGALGSPRCYSLKPASPRVRVPDGMRFTPRFTLGAA